MGTEGRLADGDSTKLCKNYTEPGEETYSKLKSVEISIEFKMLFKVMIIRIARLNIMNNCLPL